MKVELYGVTHQTSKLAFVKLIKDATGMGLKAAKDAFDDVSKLGKAVVIDLVNYDISEFIKLSNEYGFLVRNARKNRIANIFSSERVEDMIHSYLIEEYAVNEDINFECIDKGSAIEIIWEDSSIEVTPLELLSWMFTKVK
jgi:hypothetical protein